MKTNTQAIQAFLKSSPSEMREIKKRKSGNW
jgi:hypothetical protein